MGVLEAMEGYAPLSQLMDSWPPFPSLPQASRPKSSKSSQVTTVIRTGQIYINKQPAGSVA